MFEGGDSKVNCRDQACDFSNEIDMNYWVMVSSACGVPGVVGYCCIEPGGVGGGLSALHMRARSRLMVVRVGLPGTECVGFIRRQSKLRARQLLSEGYSPGSMRWEHLESRSRDRAFNCLIQGDVDRSHEVESAERVLTPRRPLWVQRNDEDSCKGRSNSKLCWHYPHPGTNIFMLVGQSYIRGFHSRNRLLP